MMTLPGLAVEISAGIFVGIIACLEIGYRLGCRSLAKERELAHEGIGPVEAAMFALFGLLLAFSFAGATSRFDVQRQLVVTEANAIGTAYLRVDLLPAADQPEIRRLFRNYLDTRLRVYEKLPDLGAVEMEMTRAARLQQAIWAAAVASSRKDPSGISARLLLPALNEMIDITTARTVALHTHLPSLIFALLIVVALLSGVVAGYAIAKRRRRSWLHILLYAGVVAMTIYVVIDLEYPHFGLIRLDTADRALFELRESIRPLVR